MNWESLEHVPEIFWWLVGLNGAGALVTIPWFYIRTRSHKHSLAWMTYGFFWGIALGFFTPIFAYYVYRHRVRRHQSASAWFLFVSLTSVFGWYAYRIYDDARSRAQSKPLSLFFGFLGFISLLVLVTVPVVWLTRISDPNFRRLLSFPFDHMIWLWPLVIVTPVLLLWMTYLLTRPRLTVAMVHDRIDALGLLRPCGPQSLLLVKDLVKYFPVRRGVFGTTGAVVKAVDGVSFSLPRGRTLGLVGESGCGKTTVGRLILRLLAPTSGSVTFDGLDLSTLSPVELRSLRGSMQLVFQDPFGSLNPRMTVESIVGEALTVHGVARGRRRRDMVERLLERVGLSGDHLKRYPHEFSGGQRQRIGIARALALNPDFIVCDEPVSALDVSVQAQILNLLADLQQEFKLTYLFIAHDLSVVEHISDFVSVMYLGKIVEHAPAAELYKSPFHPYTMALLSSIPDPDPTVSRKRVLLTGDVPTPINPPAGCSFHTRCRYAVPDCCAAIPLLREIEPGHFAACIRVEEIRKDPESTVTGGLV